MINDDQALNQDELSSNTEQLNNQENINIEGDSNEYNKSDIKINSDIMDSGKDGEQKEENKNENNKSLEKTNLFDSNKSNNDNIDTNNDVFVDFNKDEEFKEYQDIFKNSKISKEEYNQFKERILKSTSPEEFTKELIEDYGENYKQEIELFRQTTKDLYSDDIKKKIDSYPAEVKSILLATVNKLARDMETLKKDYGVQTTTLSETKSSPTQAREEFEKLTNQLVNNDYREDQYNSIIERRIKLANQM